MKAVIHTRYGTPDVLEVMEIAKPAPGDDEVLIRVEAASVNAADWHFLTGTPFVIRLTTGLSKPKNRILGVDVAGRVEAVGGKATRFKPDDAVLGDLSGCGLGGFAEYVCAPESILAPKPAGVSFENAAALPMAAVTALQALRDRGRIRSGQSVLINGASGGVGTFAVQVAKAFGAEVTAVCSTANLDRARSLGADQVIDYTREDFTKTGRSYDLILAVNGNRSISEYRRALSPAGRYVMIGGTTSQMFQAMLLGPLLSLFGTRKMGGVVAVPNGADLSSVLELCEAGKIVPVIDRRFPLDEVPDALRYLGDGHARGKIVISFGDSDGAR